jgi:hypothetical protein
VTFTPPAEPVRPEDLFYFLLLLLSASFTLRVAVMVYSTDLYVKSAQLPLFPIARKGTNYLLSKGSKKY